MASLQQHFSMEETVRTLLQSQDALDSPSLDPLDLMKAYKDKLLEEMWKQQGGLEGPAPAEEQPTFPGACRGPEGDPDETEPLLERVKILEAENSALTMENENQQKQYERCLDEVANQVVQALLTQKDLKEECVRLRTRVFDLEQQNRILSVLFQQRVRTSLSPAPQESKRNRKAGIPAARWSSLLSLTCPRSSCSGSGSEASLSSACSEYSSGSHTWAEGRGSSKQCALNREKRMSAGSMPTEQPDLGWKEGHILKGLRRLQMRSPKELSSLTPTSRYKDCMTSNEGIYSLGVKCGPQAPKLAVTTGKSLKPGATVATLPSDSDDADDESPQSPARESCQSTGETLSVAGVGAAGLGTPNGKANLIVCNSQEEPIKLTRTTSNFLSPVLDNLLPESPTLKHGISPTESPTHIGKSENIDQIKNDKQSLVKRWNDRDSSQNRSTERKSRLDLVKQQQDRVIDKQLETGTRDMSLPIQHAAARALSWASEARQRSASMDMPHYREQANQACSERKDYTIFESPQRKPKPQACDSARKAFILRSKSADGGPEQPKQLHSPLHQKLIKVHHRPKSRSNPPGHSIPSAKSNFTKVPGTAKGPVQMAEKSESTTGIRALGCIEAAGQESPSSFSVKQSNTYKPHGLNDGPKSPSKAPQTVSKLTSRSDSITKEPISNNLPNSPLKQRNQDQPSDIFHPELSSPSPPPPPPGRTTSLLIRHSYDSLPQAHKHVIQPQTSSTVKATSNGSKPEASQQSPVKQIHSQVPIKTQDTRLMAPKMGASPKRATAKVYHPLPVQESKETDSHHLPKNRLMAQAPHEENNVRNISVSQQVSSIGDQQAAELLPQAPASLLCHGIPSNPQHSISRAIKTSIPGSSIETTQNQGNTFIVLGRHDKGETNTASKGVQTFETFNHETRQMMHGVSASAAKAKARQKTETRCNSLDSDPPGPPTAAESGIMLDWGFDEEGWLFKRSVSVSTRPPLKPVMGMNGAKARSQSFGARFMDRPNFNRSGKVRTQIKTHSGSSLNSLGDVFQGSMSCSSSYHCPMNRSLLNNFLIEEGLPVPSHLGASSDRFSLRHQREQARRLQIEEQLSSAFGDPVPGGPERPTITTIEEKVMLGIEENLQKSQEQERTTETKPKSGSSLANWFGFRKTKLPAPSRNSGDVPKIKEEKKEQKIGSLLGGRQAKSDKKKERRRSDGKESSAGRRESHDAVRQCLSMPVQGIPGETPGPAEVCGDAKIQSQRMNLRPERERETTSKISSQDCVIGPGCTMRTLDSGIGTFPLPDSASFSSSSSSSSILNHLPTSASTPDQSLSQPGAPGSSSEEGSPSPSPRWRVPLSGTKDHSELGMPTNTSDISVTLFRSVPSPSLAFLQPIQSLSEPVVTCANVCDTLSKLPRLGPEAISDLASCDEERR